MLGGRNLELEMNLCISRVQAIYGAVPKLGKCESGMVHFFRCISSRRN